MTDEQKEKITELLAKILLGMKGAKTFFEALIDDNVKGTIEVNASKIIRAITGSEEAVEELKQYLCGLTRRKKRINRGCR